MMFDKKHIDKFRKETIAQFKILALRASKLQITPEYAEYQTQYRLVREKLINEMINCDEPEPLKYAFQMNSYVERIKALGVLINEIENDIKKGNVNEEPEEKA